MSVSVVDEARSVFDHIAMPTRRIAIARAVTWTVLLTVTVAAASLAPEIAFVTAISTSSPFSEPCKAKGFVRVLLDDPKEVLCLPASAVRRSEYDFFVPTVFAALIVAGSACFVRSLT